MVNPSSSEVYRGLVASALPTGGGGGGAPMGTVAVVTEEVARGIKGLAVAERFPI